VIETTDVIESNGWYHKEYLVVFLGPPIFIIFINDIDAGIMSSI